MQILNLLRMIVTFVVVTACVFDHTMYATDVKTVKMGQMKLTAINTVYSVAKYTTVSIKST